MRKNNWKKYKIIASWGAVVAIAIGFFQFMAIANVLFSIASILIYLWMFPSAQNGINSSLDKEGAFLFSFLSLCTAVMFLTTTPAIIVAWAYNLRDGYVIESVILEAFVLSVLLFITAASGLQATLAKKDINQIVSGNSETDSN